MGLNAQSTGCAPPSLPELASLVTSLFAAGDSEVLLERVGEVLVGLGASGDFVIVYADDPDGGLDVAASNLPELSPSAAIEVEAFPEIGVAGVSSRTSPLRLGADGRRHDFHTALPLAAEGETYGYWLLPEIVPAPTLAALSFVASQLGLALVQVQTGEALQGELARESAKLAALRQAGEVIRQPHLDLILAKLMELALSVVGAEVGCLLFREDAAAPLRTRVTWGLDGELLAELCGPDGEGLVDGVVRTGKPVALSAADDDFTLATDSARRTLRNLIAVPLATQAGVLGCVVVVNATDEEIERGQELLTMVADLTSNAVENAVLHASALEKERLQGELAVAGRIQRSLVPADAPAIPGAELAARQLQCDDSGGDYYDFFAMPDGRVGFCIADATGHGVGAALIVTTARALLRADLDRDVSLADRIARLNDLLEADLGDDKFTTLFFGVFDAATRRLEYASAGHYPPFLYRAASGRTEALEATGPPLGIVPGMNFDSRTTEPLAEGDLLVVSTDGIPEARNEAGEFFGDDRFEASLALYRDLSAHDYVERIVGDALAFEGAAPRRDDVTVLCLRIDGTAGDGSGSRRPTGGS